MDEVGVEAQEVATLAVGNALAGRLGLVRVHRRGILGQEIRLVRSAQRHGLAPEAGDRAGAVMPGDDVLTHRNHGGQAIIIQRHAQRTEVVVAIEDARVLVLHSLQTAQRFQRGFHWDSSDAQIEVERVTRKHQVSLVIDKHHLTGGVTGTSGQDAAEQADSRNTWKREKKLKFSYKEQREYETIEDDIANLEAKVEQLDADMAENATNSVKLGELLAEKEAAEQALEEKMERWEYLEELAAKIAGQE